MHTNMTSKSKACRIGGGIGSLAAAAFMIRDGNLPGRNISILESAPILGGSLDAAGDAERGYSMLKFSQASEEILRASRITSDRSPGFFETSFWHMWSTTFAFQPWHSAVEFKRYLLRFMLEFSGIETLAGVKRTIYNQYDSLAVLLQRWLVDQGIHFVTDCRVTEIGHKTEEEKFVVTSLQSAHAGQPLLITVDDGVLVFLQSGSMTDASSLGSMSTAPAKRTKAYSGGWPLWECLASGRPQFGRPEVFNSSIAQVWWESFTVTVKDPAFFNQMAQFSGNEAGTGGRVTFKDSNWLLSVVLAFQPHFANQPACVQVFWGYALFPDRIGNFVAKSMAECNGAEILEELCGHLHFDPETFATANCIPCRMPYITSMFMPRIESDRPYPVPPGSKNLAFVSQFVEIPEDVVFTVEYSVRAAQMAVYELMGVERKVPIVTPHAKSRLAQFEALLKAFK